MKSAGRRARRREGSALVVVLLLTALITGIVIACLASATLERKTADSHLERYRASILASWGVEQTLAVLGRETARRVEIPQEDGTTKRAFPHYLSAPGLLVIPGLSVSPPDAGEAPVQTILPKKIIPLSSGAPVAASRRDPLFNPANLNIRLFAQDGPASWLLANHDGRGASGPVMAVKWIYLRRNHHNKPRTPSAWTEEEDFTEEPAIDPNRPIIGRYAYWVDDESSKINYNTAWKRDPGPNPSVHPNPSRLSHPSLVNMMALFFPDGTPAMETTADALFRWRDRSPNRPFNSFADARQADASLLELLEHNKFELTHYNHDPDVNVFGEGRILLTTRRSLAPQIDGQPVREFLDILRDDVEESLLDPGLKDDLAGGQPDWRAGADGSVTLPNKFDAAVRKLMRYLKARNWPFAPGRSFTDKYHPGVDDDDPRLAQLAVNIIDYVRCKESRQPVVAPLHFGLDAARRYTLHPDHAFGPLSCQGVSRAPAITEMGFWVSPEPVTMPVGESMTPPDWPLDEAGNPKPLHPCYFKIELHLPPGYQVMDIAGMLGVNLAPSAGSARRWFVSLDETFAGFGSYYFQSPTTRAILPMRAQSSKALPIVQGDVTGPNGSTLRPGAYVTVTKLLYREEPPAAAPRAAMRCALYQGTSGPEGLLAGPESRWPCFARAPHRAPVLWTWNAASASAADMSSLEVDDPQVNVAVADWQPNKNNGNTFGSLNSISTLGKRPQSTKGAPLQDADPDGRLTQAGCRMPPPLGAGSNNLGGDNGLVTSIGELGFVNTGADAGAAGIPWRTLRLQPGSAATADEISDWSLLDLFSVVHTSTEKVKEPAAVYFPHQTSVGGRVNINARLHGFAGMERLSAIHAALAGARALSKKEEAPIIAANILHHVLADGTHPGRHYGLPGPASPEALARNVYDTPAEICEIKGVADAGEQSEDLFREVIGLLSCKSGVFAIHTVGQALKQTRSGGLVVTAEQRRQVIVERMIDHRGTPESGDDIVRFKTLYARELNP